MRILDVAFSSPPKMRGDIVGTAVIFENLVRDAGMRMVVTGRFPQVFVHEGEVDFRVPQPGRSAYCISSRDLPVGVEDRSREIMRRLAYSFQDWAAREVVARYHRDVRRSMMGDVIETRPKLGQLPGPVRIRRFLRSHPASTIGEIAEATGVAQSNVSRTIAGWEAEGSIDVERVGRIVRCSLVERTSDDEVGCVFGR